MVLLCYQTVYERLISFDYLKKRKCYYNVIIKLLQVLAYFFDCYNLMVTYNFTVVMCEVRLKLTRAAVKNAL